MQIKIKVIIGDRVGNMNFIESLTLLLIGFQLAHITTNCANWVLIAGLLIVCAVERKL